MAVDETDTEPTEETLDESENITFEDFEDTTEDNESEDSTDSDSESNVESEEEDTQEEAEESDEETEAEPEEQPESEQSDTERQKEFNRQMAQKRIQEKQQRELSIQQQQDQYLNEAENDKDLAFRQLQIDAYTNRVEANTNKLTNAYGQALKDFDVLRSNDPVIKAEIDSAIDSFEAQHMKLDAYGNPTQVTGDFYTYLQNKADSITRLAGLGARKQVTDKTREKAKTSVTPSRAPREPKGDPDLEAFDEEANK